MNHTSPDENLILPTFSDADLKALKKYFEFNDRYRAEMNLELQKRLKDHPVWGPLIKQMSPEQQKAQNERSQALQKAAIYDGKWEDYAKDLMAQGRVYARMNVGYSEWYELISMAKIMIMPYIRKDLKAAEDVIEVIDGLSKLVDYVMYSIALAYFLEKNEAIREGEERFRLIFNASDDIIMLVGREGEILTINHSVSYNTEELIGKKVYDLQNTENSLKMELAVKAAIETKKPATFEVDVEINGEIKYYSGKVSPVFDEQGVITSAVVVSRDVTKEKQAENELKQMNLTLEQRVSARTEELDIINKELESFTYSVSHDLRAPLRAINGFSEILVEEASQVLNEDGKDALNEIIMNVKKMGQLVDDLLEFSRLGKQNIAKAIIKMNELFDSAGKDLGKYFPNTRITIGDLPPVYGDRAMLKQVIYNLVSNAFKYSSKNENPTVEIGASEKNESIVYYIKDNGVGFNMAYYSKLFNVFQRLHGSRDFEGTGVGLAIVQRIISKHNGKVWAEGKEGEGATFYFSLPIK